MKDRIIKLTVMLMALLLAFALTACGEDETTGATSGAEHTHEYEETVLIAPTCTKTGTMFLKCKTCGDVDYKEIATTSHTEVVDEAVAPTCTKTGLTEGKHCSCCGKVIVAQEVVETVDHEYEETVLIAPSCEDGGLMQKKCKTCGTSNCEAISCNGHITVIDEAVEATCLATGLTEGAHCSVCNKILVEQQMTEITDHKWEVIEAVEAKCDKPGLTAGTKCAYCGMIDIEQETVWVSHEFENGHCTSCGRTEPSSGLLFQRNADGGYTVAGIGTCTDTHVIIPDIYNGLPVTTIGKDAFYNCSSIKTVEIPDTVTTINMRAFGYSGLTSVVIPDSVTSIDMFAFTSCTNLTSVTLSSNVECIGSGAFSNCDLTSVTIPDGALSIGSTAFYGNKKLTSIWLTNSVVEIGQEAFNDCSELTDIYFEGTSDEWIAISKGLNWIITTDYKIHCTDGDFTVYD